MFRKHSQWLRLVLALCFGTSLLALIVPSMNLLNASAAAVGYDTSTSWVGYYVEKPGKTPTTGGVTYVAAEWNISCNWGSKTGNTHATWIGIGGVDIGKSGSSPNPAASSIKLGTSSDSTTYGGLGSIWLQDTTGHITWFASNQNCRDHIIATLTYNTANGYYDYDITDTSAKHVKEDYNGEITNGVPDAQSGEWMDSRGTCDGNISPLDNFNYSTFTHVVVKTTTNAQVSPSPLTSMSSYATTMVTNGTRMAYPSILNFSNADGAHFKNTFVASGPGTACAPHNVTRFN